MAQQPAIASNTGSNKGTINSFSSNSSQFNHFKPYRYNSESLIGSRVVGVDGTRKAIVTQNLAKAPSSNVYMLSGASIGQGSAIRPLRSGSIFPEYTRSINYNEFNYSSLTATAYARGHWNDVSGSWDAGFPITQLDNFGTDNAARATEVAITFMPNGKSQTKVSL